MSRALARAATATPVRLSPAFPVAASAAGASRRSYATPSGPPPKGFRLPRLPDWDQEKDGTFDRVGKYFLLTEMARGMYVLLEQFFRPP